MILSPYHKPPCKPPRKSPSTPPLSPKRKRDEDVECVVPLQLDTDRPPRVLDAVSDEADDSPRMKVARQFRTLEIRPVSPPSLAQRDSPQAESPRKRAKKRNPPSSRDHALAREKQEIADANKGKRCVVEIWETPDCRNRHRKPEGDDVAGTAPSHDYAESELSSRSVSPLPSRSDISPDQASLTWQDEEITGHELDLGGDDDGEGINGIGFKPTPAMAYARKQRRKQQVNEWKMREAREARRKRLERRRDGRDCDGAGASGVVRGADGKRIVRFVGDCDQ